MNLFYSFLLLAICIVILTARYCSPSVIWKTINNISTVTIRPYEL